MSMRVSEIVSSKIGDAITNSNNWSGLFYNVKVYGVVGDGTTDDYQALYNLVNTTIAGDEATIVFPRGTYRIGTDINFPLNITLCFVRGAMLSPDDGIRVLIGGDIDAGSYQIFTGDGLIRGNTKSELNVLWFGAVGDGETDDSAKIQLALDWCLERTKGQVYVPPGVYITGSKLNVYSNTVFYGAGMGVTTLKATPNPTFGVIDAFYNHSNIEIYGFTVDGNHDGSFNTREACGIRAKQKTRYVKIHHCEIINVNDNGIESNGEDNEISHNIIRDCWANGIYCIGNATELVNRNWIHHNYVEDCSKTTTTWDGIDLDRYCSWCIIDSNIVNENDIIIFDDVSGTSCTGNQIINNTIYSSRENGINLLGNSKFTDIRGNKIYLADSWGITIEGSPSRVKISENMILGATEHGIYIRRGSVYISDYPNNMSILNNIIENVGSDAVGTYSGIYLDTGCYDIKIEENKFIDSRGTTFMKHCIDCANAGNDIVIRNNGVKTNVTGAKINYKAATTTAHGQRVQNNHNYNPVGSFTAPTLPASGTPFTNPYPFACRVFIYGGTVTGIDMNGSTIANTTNVQVVLEPGDVLNMAYSSAPTWKWYGL